MGTHEEETAATGRWRAVEPESSAMATMVFPIDV